MSSPGSSMTTAAGAGRRDLLTRPPDAPGWALVPGGLWAVAVAEAAERRKDATVARELELSLPHELTDEQRAHLAFSIAEGWSTDTSSPSKPSFTPLGTRTGSNDQRTP